MDAPPINPMVERATTGTRVKKEMAKWKFKQYEPKDAVLLAQIMIAWAEENRTETTFTRFLVDIAHCSYGKLQRMGADCQELADALDIVGEIFAERIREEWKADERMDINKYAPKMFDLMSPLVKAKEQAKLKVELSAERGVPYHDPTYPNLLTKGEQ